MAVDLSWSVTCSGAQAMPAAKDNALRLPFIFAFLPSLPPSLIFLPVTFYSNILTLGLMSVSTLLSGDLLGALAYAQADHKAAVLLLVYTLLAYVAISLHMALVKSFGSVAAVLVGNSRKTMTICLSFLLFPKPFSNLYVVGGMLVLAGLTVSVYVKNMDKKKGADDAVLNCKGEVVGPTAVGNGGLIQQQYLRKENEGTGLASEGQGKAGLF